MSKLLARSDLTDADLADLYAYPPGPWLRANMVASADGAANHEGVSAGLSSATDRHVFALLRTLADVILVGAATVRTERYAPVRPRELWSHLREGRAPTPPIAVVSMRLDLDRASRLLADSPPHARTIVITGGASPPDRRAELAKHADVIVAGEKDVDLKAAVEALAERGYQRILAEGGPHLLAQLLAVGRLDELCLTVAPLMTGPAAGRIVAGTLAPERPLPLTLAHVIEADDFLLCRYARKDNLSRTGRGAHPGQADRAQGDQPRRQRDPGQREGTRADAEGGQRHPAQRQPDRLDPGDRRADTHHPAVRVDGSDLLDGGERDRTEHSSRGTPHEGADVGDRNHRGTGQQGRAKRKRARSTSTQSD